MDGAIGRDFHSGDVLQIQLAAKPAVLCEASEPAMGSFMRKRVSEQVRSERCAHLVLAHLIF
jgi:hypothetical protein